MKTIFIVFLSMLFASPCIAGIADLSIELDFNTTNGIVVERYGEFVVRITNNGPDIAAIDSSLQFPISMSSGIIRAEDSIGLPLEFAPTMANNNNICFFTTIIGEPIPGGNVSYVFGFDVPPMAVDETIECFGAYTTYFQAGTREITWQIRNSFDDDPNQSNNSQTIVFGLPPRSVPLNNILFLFVLFLSALLIGCKSFQNQNVQD